MAADLRVDFHHLDELLVSMSELSQQSHRLISYFTETVCDGSGFDYPSCALAPIGDQLPKIAATFTTLHHQYLERWAGLREAIHTSASNIASTDSEVGAVFDAQRDSTFAPILGLLGGGPPGLLPLDPVSDDLEKPKDGKARLRHPARFDDAADAWDTARDVINAFIGFLGRFGAGIPKLDERSLREYVVYPLAANYEAIGANANACGHFADGMSTWAANFRAVGGKVDAALEGRTGTALVAHLDVYSVVMLAVGGVVRKGAVVYEGIGTMSETIAVEVEKVLETMGERLLKLSSRIGSKAVPFLGWATLAVDLAEHGLGIVQDVIDDIMECKKLIDQCFDLVDEITAWAETQADLLKAFHQVLDMVEQLPGVDAEGVVPDLNRSVRDVEKSLDDVVVSFEDAKTPEADELNSALDGLSGLTDDDGGDGGDGGAASSGGAPDGEVLMAPGPLGIPAEGGSTPGQTIL